MIANKKKGKRNIIKKEKRDEETVGILHLPFDQNSIYPTRLSFSTQSLSLLRDEWNGLAQFHEMIK